MIIFIKRLARTYDLQELLKIITEFMRVFFHALARCLGIVVVLTLIHILMVDRIDNILFAVQINLITAEFTKIDKTCLSPCFRAVIFLMETLNEGLYARSVVIPPFELDYYLIFFSIYVFILFSRKCDAKRISIRISAETDVHL